MWFVPRDNLTLLTPEDAAATYSFNKHIIKHRFCPTCGIHPYGEGVDPKGNRMAATTCVVSKPPTLPPFRCRTSTVVHREAFAGQNCLTSMFSVWMR